MPLQDFHAGRSRGFTVAEMLIVIALIGTLAVLLFPASGRLQRRSDAAKCQNNLRQLANAGFLYAADNGGRLPDRTRWTYSTTPVGSLLPYLGLATPNQKIDSALTCPAIQKSRFRTTQVEWHRTYAINQYATGSDTGNSDDWNSTVLSRDVPVRTLGVDQASQQAFFMDGPVVFDSALGGPGYRYSSYSAPDRLNPAKGDGDSGWNTPFVHDDHVNVVFLDGHVEAISREQAEAGLVGPTNPSASLASTSPRTRPFWGTKK